MLPGKAVRTREMVARALAVTVLLASSAAAGDKDLRQAALAGDAEQVQKLLTGGANPNSADGQGVTPLMSAARGGHDDAIRLLLKAGASVDRCDKASRSAMNYAAASGVPEAVGALLEAGIAVDYACPRGGTALLNGAGFSRVAQLLIDRGAKVNTANNSGVTALMRAAGAEDSGSVRILLEHGAEVNARNWNEETALLYAAGDGRRENIRLLVRHGADLSATSKQGETALARARRLHREASANLLNDLQTYGPDGYQKMVDAGMVPFLRADGIDLWRHAPSRASTAVGELKADPTRRDQVEFAGPDNTVEMDDDALLAMAREYLVPRAKELGADAIVVTRSQMENHRSVKTTPGYKEAVGIGVLAGLLSLGGRTLVVIPGRDVFIDRTFHLEGSAIRYDHSAVAATPTDESVAAEADQTYWASVKDTTDPKLVEMYLEKFPNGRFAQAARSKLAVDREGTAQAAGPAFVYFYTEILGRFKIRVGVDGSEIAKLAKGEHVKLALPAGTHEFSAHHAKSKTFTIRGGQTYLFLASPAGLGWKLELVDAGSPLVRGGKPVPTERILDGRYVIKE